MISIVIPTYKEADNLTNLVQRIHDVLKTMVYEIIIVDDDSPDDTSAICSELAKHYPLVLLVAKGRPRDLSLSVVDGIKSASFDCIAVMDADLSHPPVVLLDMLEKLQLNPKSFVVGSRYIDGGSFDREWSIWRFINSYVATKIAQPLIKCSDPMSGFFAFNRVNVAPERLNPIGYKIGLELAVKGDFDRIEEVAISFQDREIGESKMNLGQQFKYLRHLRRLYLHKFGNLAEFVHFAFVGASGFVIDIIFYYLLQVMGLSHLVARAISFLPAVSWNWALNRATTFDQREKRPKAKQWFEFVATGMVGFAINYGVYAALTFNTLFFDTYRVLALVLGVASASIFNFAASTLFVYSDKRR